MAYVINSLYKLLYIYYFEKKFHLRVLGSRLLLMTFLVLCSVPLLADFEASPFEFILRDLKRGSRNVSDFVTVG